LENKLKSLALSFLINAYDDPALIRTEDPHWLSHIRPVIAMHKPATFSLSKLYDELLLDGELGEYNGEIITMEHLRTIYAILAKYSRSDLLPKKMTQTLYPQYSSAIPIVLTAYREQFGVKYSQWTPNNDYMKTAILGKQLETLPEVYKYLVSLKNRKPEFENNTELGDEEYLDSMGIETPESIDVFDIEVRKELREFTLDGGNLPGTTYTALKRYHPSHPLGSANLSKFYWCMLTQTWIFDPKVRHPNMITNLLDWDIPAKPLEEFSSSIGFKIGKPTASTSQGFKVGKLVEGLTLD